jgi:hypothetical protein
MRMRLIIISGLSGYTIFFQHYLINGNILEKINYATENAYFDFLYNLCPKCFVF